MNFSKNLSLFPVCFGNGNKRAGYPAGRKECQSLKESFEGDKVCRAGKNLAQWLI
jgi:hypothetical protein